MLLDKIKTVKANFQNSGIFRFPPVASAIALACIIVFVVQSFADNIQLSNGDNLGRLFTFTFGVHFPYLIKGAIWQPFTYAFLHGSLTHIALNLFTLLFFGSSVERIVGGKRFWKLFIWSSIVGGLAWVVFDYYEPTMWMHIQQMPYDICKQLTQRWGESQVAGLPYNVCVGASAGVFGLIGAFVALCPRQKIVLLLFFVIPVKLQARFMGLFLMIFSVGAMIFGTARIGHIAHLFGGLYGYLMTLVMVARARRKQRDGVKV